MNKYIGTKIDVLDKGFVALVDYMGSDSDIVSAARVSYGKGTKTKRSDKALIRYLVRNKHTSPLEQCVVKFHIKAPIFVFRQMHRHRTQALNEISGRYSEIKDECYLPDLKRIQKQSEDNKQGSGEALEEQSQTLIQKDFKEEQVKAFNNYEFYLTTGLARELARINLPVSTYSEMYTSMSLHNLFHFLKLRMDPHTQYETRQCANAMFELIKPLFPIASEAFEDYILHAKTFSKQELELIKLFLNKQDFYETEQLPKEEFDFRLSKRELKEFKEKLDLE